MEAGMTEDIFTEYHQQFTDRFFRNLYLMPMDMPYALIARLKNIFHTKSCSLNHSPILQYHLCYISLEIVPQNWVCKACEASGTWNDQNDDVILPYMDMCMLI